MNWNQKLIILRNFLIWTMVSAAGSVRGCTFHTADGLAAESEGVRFVRLREDARVGKEVLALHAYPRSRLALRNAGEGNDDYKFFSLVEKNSTYAVVTLSSSLDDLVDRDVPRNLLKFKIFCAVRSEKLDEGSYLSVTVYIEDINDNSPIFLKTPYIVDVYENTTVGTIVFEGIKAFDRDKPNTPNSEVHFSLFTIPEQLSSDGSLYFALKSPHRPLLVLKKDLDFDAGVRLFKLPIFAWDRGTPARKVNTTLTINVIDVDDMPPKFTEGVYRTKINEFYPLTGLPIRVPLYFSPPIMAFDQDSLNASLNYELISGNERELFRVNANNGIIYLQKEIDLEEESLPANTFVLQLEARQKDDPLKRALARIEIEILDLNDNVPEFEADFYNISIVENLPTGFSVLQVNAVDSDQGGNAEFIYNLIEEDATSGAFQIDPRSGWITVRNDRLLDREDRKSLHLFVEAIERNTPYVFDSQSKQPKPSSVKVEITLLDTNDNTPRFEKGNLYEFKVPLSSPVGHKVGTVVAVDPDEGQNGLLVYSLQRPKGSGYIPFRLDTKNGTVFVNGPLRRGRIAMFVEASDQPINPSERRFSLAVITIEVYSTIDEQSIDFVGAPYEFWVGSTVPLGASVGQVRTNLVYDGEEEIMYDLLHTYSEGVPFAIEERSGIITVIRVLSEFSRKLYSFEAVANYIFGNSSQAQAMSPNSSKTTTSTNSDLIDEGVLITNVTIHVVNKPDAKIPSRPVIEEINMNTIKFHVEENVVGGVIGQLLYKNGLDLLNNNHASFRDMKGIGNATIGSRYRSPSSKTRKRLRRRLVSDMSIKLRYIIANQHEVVNKITITDDGTLMTVSGLDREAKPEYDLTVIVEYSTGLMGGAGIYQVNIKVDDVNDNPPKFNAPTFIGLINENSPAGTPVLINIPLQIIDHDEGKNAEFRVILQGEHSEQFSIDFFNKTEEQTNQSHLGPYSAGMFQIYNLTQQWDEDYNLVDVQNQLTEASKVMTSEPFFQVKFIGKIQLDREKDQIYNLKIIAIDSGGLSSFSNLNIFVADVNDNAPIFERISVFKDSKVEIREYTTDMEIYFVESSFSQQMQQVPTSMIVPPYHIPGTPRKSSDSSFKRNIHIAHPKLPYGLRPRVRSQTKQRTSRAATPENKIQLMRKCPLFAIYEDILVGTKVLQVTAVDDDFGKNAQIHYDIVGERVDVISSSVLKSKHNGVKFLIVDKLTGELSINYPLIANIQITVNISATDIDGLKDTTCLRFTVIDVNDHSPVFKKFWYSFDTPEGAYKESVLGQVTAFDLDYGNNANITYSLIPKNVPFSIKPSSGVIRILSDLDREMQTKYNFQVIASDNAEPSQRLSSSVDVEVNVIDINDNKPEFTGYDDMVNAKLYLPNTSDESLLLPLYKAYLDRSTQVGTFVKQINAIDKDFIGNGNGLVLYSLHHSNVHSPIFQIDNRDGAVTTINDFRSFNEYEHLNLTVVASDLGSPSLSATAVILVNLQGEGIFESPSISDQHVDFSNLSIFQHPYYEVKVVENNPTPVELIKFNFTKGFSAKQFRWSLSIDKLSNDTLDEQLPFEFDANSEILYGVKAFDRETVDRFQIRLRGDKLNRVGRTYSKVEYPVIDERIDGLEKNECRIVVLIMDENDNSPKFKNNGHPVVAVIPKGAKYGYPVTTVQASDIDEGLNSEIRYRILNEPLKLFNINEITGKIRLVAGIPLNERNYGFDVKATDRKGADDGRSSIVNVFIYVIDESRQVCIVVAGKPVDVERNIDALMTALSNAIQMDVRVRLLEPHIGGTEPATDAYIYAVDFRNNAIMMEMEQLQESLASLQFDALQLWQTGGTKGDEQEDKRNPMEAPSEAIPRIIELVEFGQKPRSYQSSVTVFGSLEIVSIVLITLCGISAALIAFCLMCLRQKRNIWKSTRQQEFSSSETGLGYTIARIGIGSCRQHVHHQQRKPQQHCGKSLKTISSLMPESVCSSSQTQSTLAVSQKMEQQPSLLYYNDSHQRNGQRQMEVVDAPLPKTSTVACSFTQLENQVSSVPFLLKYNASLPVNNLRSVNPYETSMFSLHSNADDSGVGFLSNPDLYESSTDSVKVEQKCRSERNLSTDLLCPRHAKEHMEAKRKSTGKLFLTESSDNYEESLKNTERHVALNYRSPISLPLCDQHRHNYQNTAFDKRSCVRHSFSGFKDDLVQNSPKISLRPRRHVLRNSMNDLEERLYNLEQSFRRPSAGLGKQNAIF